MGETARPKRPWASPKTPSCPAERPLLNLSHMKTLREILSHAINMIQCHQGKASKQTRQASMASHREGGKRRGNSSGDDDGSDGCGNGALVGPGDLFCSTL